jgi:RND family efflux transporter MFP subunit
MKQLAPEATRKPPAERALPVEVVQVQAEAASARIVTSGSVEPARRVTIVPEVTGRIVQLSDDLVVGGRVREGDLLVKIDPRDYQLNLQQQESQLASAQLQLEQELGQRSIAAREWELLGEGQAIAQKNLVLREPHLAAAEQAVLSAKSGIERARLTLGRTTIRAPFNASVLSESVAPGQVVSPGAPIATLIGSDRFWVRVSIPVERLDALTIPGTTKRESGSPLGTKARIVQPLSAGREIVREGEVLRLETQLDAESRTAQVIVGVESPLDPPEGGLPLLPGAFVRVELEGNVQAGIIVIPSRALHEGDTVWIVDEGQRLRVRRVVVGYSNDEVAHVLSGLEEGARVVVSPMALPLDGMIVRVEGGHVEARAKGSLGQPDDGHPEGAR